MTSVASLPTALQTVFTTVADQSARDTGVIQRVRKFTGASLAQALVFGLLHKPDASRADLCQAAALCEVQVTRQAIDQRLTGERRQELATWLLGLLECAVEQVISSQPQAIPLLRRFTATIVEDSSVVTLPEELAEEWAGCGGSAGTSGAALKLGVRYHLENGQLDGPLLAAGRVHDRVLAAAHPPLPPVSLYLVDLGYFSLERFATLQREEVYVLTRALASMHVLDEQDRFWDLPTFLERPGTNRIDVAVRCGKTVQLPARLLAIRVPEAVANERRRKLRAEAKREGRTPSQRVLALAAWTVLLTTAPAERLSLADALVLARARWQIELLWKLWKSEGGVRTLQSAQPEARFSLLCAKLLGMVVQHWVLLATGWRYPGQSLVLAARAVRAEARALLRAVWTGRGLRAVLARIRQALPEQAKVEGRRTKPSTAQLLADPSLLCLP
jgi:hypothetical protein